MDTKLRKLFKRDFKKIKKDDIYSFDLSYPEYNKKFRINPIKNKKIKCSNNISDEDKKDLDNINKIICNNDYRILTFFDEININILNEKFKDNALIISYKYITLNTKSFNSFIYQLYSNKGFRNIEDINNFCKNIGIHNKFNLTILILKPLNNKIKLNTIYLKSKQYITTNFLETVEISKLYFNKNSLEFLDKQNLKNFMSFKFWKSRVMFQTIRKWIYKNISLDEHEHIIFFSSIVLYLYGLRNCNDIDLIIYKNINKFNDITNTMINKDFIDSDLFFFLDISVKGTQKWKDHWNIWLNEWSKLCNYDTFDDIIYNPNNYFYFMGMKIISLNVDIVRRIKRNRPRSFADLYVIKKNIYNELKLPIIPKKEEVYLKIKDLDRDKIKEILMNGGKHHKNCKELIIYKDIDETKFLNTMIWCLKERYKIIISREKISKYLLPKQIIIKIKK